MNFDLCLETHGTKRKVMAKLLDTSAVLHTHSSSFNDWAPRNTPEIHVVLLLPNDDVGEQTLALQMLQLQ